MVTCGTYGVAVASVGVINGVLVAVAVGRGVRLGKKGVPVGSPVGTNVCLESGLLLASLLLSGVQVGGTTKPLAKIMGVAVSVAVGPGNTAARACVGNMAALEAGVGV